MRKLLLALLLALAYAVPAAAQQPQGTECWVVTPDTRGSGPPLICVNTIRNGQAISTFSGSGGFTTVATKDNSTLMWTGAAPTTWTITLPNPAFDGQIIEVGTDTTLTTMVTVQAAASPQNQTLSATFSGQTVTAATSVEWRFSLSALKWFRTR